MHTLLVSGDAVTGEVVLLIYGNAALVKYISGVKQDQDLGVWIHGRLLLALLRWSQSCCKP